MAQNLASWTGTNCTVATATETTGSGQVISFLRVTRTGANPSITSPVGRGTIGKLYRQFRALVRKHGGSGVATTFVGRLSWTTPGHGFSASYKDELSAPANKSIDEWFPLTWAPGDAPTAGGTDWVDNIIDQVKLEFSNDASAVWDVLLVGEGGDGASAFADTEQLLPNAATKPTFDSAASTFLLPKKNLVPPANWVLLHTVSLTLSGYGEVEVQWTGTVDFEHSDYGYLSLLIDTSPTFDGAGVINNFNQQLKIRANNAFQLSQTMVHMATGLAAGSHTFDLYGQQDNHVNQHEVRDSRFIIRELKR